MAPAGQGDSAGLDPRILAQAPGGRQHVAGPLAAPEHRPRADQGGGVGLAPAPRLVGVHHEGAETLARGFAGIDVDVGAHPRAAVEQDHRRPGRLVGRAISGHVPGQHVPATCHGVERPQHHACLLPPRTVRRNPRTDGSPRQRVALRSGRVKHKRRQSPKLQGFAQEAAKPRHRLVGQGAVEPQP